MAYKPAPGDVTAPSVVGSSNVVPVGVQASGIITSVLVWGVINDNQNPDWVPVNDAQTGNWVGISDNQTPNWQAVNDTQPSNWVQVADGNTVVWTQIPT